jgi:predicted  nucleic acid-binding Zn-ribbon protein
MRLILVILLVLGTFIPTASSYAKCDGVIDCYERALSDLKQAHDKIKALNQDAAKKAAELEKLKTKYEANLETNTQALVNNYQARLQQLEEAYAKRLASTSELADLSLKSIQQIEQQIKVLLAELKKTNPALVKDYQAQLERVEAFYTKKLASTTELAESSLKSAQRAEQQIKALSEKLSAVQSAQQRAEQQIKALSEQLDAAQSAQQRAEQQIKALSEQLDAAQSAQQRAEQQIKALSDVNAVKLAHAAKREINALSEKLKGSFSKALVVFNSVANEQGANAKGDANTLAFWQIPYLDRFKVKGIPALALHSNYYNPTLYQSKGPATYVDVVEDLEGKVALLMTASADGIDPKTMKMINPKFIEGNKGVYEYQFASGWSSHDYDSDGNNCATAFGKVTQHYGNCWYYSLGADADSPRDDNHWGPHLQNEIAQPLNLKTDGSSYTRLRRITRYIIF